MMHVNAMRERRRLFIVAEAEEGQKFLRYVRRMGNNDATTRLDQKDDKDHAECCRKVASLSLCSSRTVYASTGTYLFYYCTVYVLHLF